MRKRQLFLRWALLASVIAAGAGVAYFLGWFGLTWRFDSTKISFLILALFVTATAYVGRLTWIAGELVERKRLNKNADVSGEVAEIGIVAETGWLAHDFCEKLGLLGTLVGLVMVLIEFSSFESGDAEAVSRLMAMMAVGLGTAYLTTIVGLVCGLLLALQLKHLERALERLK